MEQLSKRGVIKAIAARGDIIEGMAAGHSRWAKGALAKNGELKLRVKGVFYLLLHTIPSEEIMYQVTFSIAADYVNWFYAVGGRLRKSLDGQAVMVTRGEPSRLFVAVACENRYKKHTTDRLFEAIVELFCVEAKRHYLKENLNLSTLSEEKYNILLAALVEFDSFCDRQLIKQAVSLESGLNLDGVYNFAFSDIKKRWKETCDLTRENALYLADNEIFFELIKYMFSAITPKIESVFLYFDGKSYTLFDRISREIVREASTEEELLCALISVAPVSLELCEGIDSGLRKKLSAMFGITPLKMSNLPG